METYLFKITFMFLEIFEFEGDNLYFDLVKTLYRFYY